MGNRKIKFWQRVLNGLTAVSTLSAFAVMAQDMVRILPQDLTVSYERIVPHSYEDYQQNLKMLTQSIPHKESAFWVTSFNWGDDEIMNEGLGDSHLTYQLDMGNYHDWYQNNQTWLHTNSLSASSTDKYSHSLEHAWFCINLANVGLEQLPTVSDCSSDQKRMLEGQLLFYRAWWHQELMTYYGAMPYVDYPLEYDRIVKLPRLSAEECAHRCAADFERAAELLPAEADYAAVLMDADDRRVLPTSLAAQAYQGKVLLWAASPLNYNGPQTGALANGNTYKYNTQLAQQAAQVLGNALSSVQSGQTPYQLAEFRFGEGKDAGEDDTEYTYVWTNELQNSEMDPSQPMDCFIVREDYTDKPAEVIVGGGPDGRNCVVVNANAYPAEEWDTQLFVYTPNKVWESGEKYRFHMWYKASKPITIDTQIHGTPGGYLHWQMLIPNPSFTTEWHEYTWEGTIFEEGNNQQQTIAFNLNKNKDYDPSTEYTFYFSDITWESAKMVKVDGTKEEQYFEKRCIVVNSSDMVEAAWDNQFWVVANEPFHAGDSFEFSADVLAQENAEVGSQIHGKEPGDYLHWAAVGSIPFSTEWSTYHATGTFPADAEGGQSIAFNMNDFAAANTYIFGRISLKINGVEMVNNGDLLTDDCSSFFKKEDRGYIDPATISDGYTIFVRVPGEEEEEEVTPHNNSIDDIYNHRRPKNGSSNFYTDIFYTTGQNWATPGAKEVLFSGLTFGPNSSNWNFSKTWGSKIDSFVDYDKVIHMPTANYVNYAYGMANGLPLDDPDSGFDPAHPFQGRDPRFYHDLVFDGARMADADISDNYTDRSQQYADFQTGSMLRDPELGSRTGYFCQKLVPHTANKYDRAYEWSNSLQCYLPYMRLADVYLMYAEACAAYGGANASSGCNLTAADAINVLRDRVNAGHVADKYLYDDRKFMDEVRRERACELAFEGHRWADLSRWLLLTEAPYNKKTSQEFTRTRPNETNTYGYTVENEWYRYNDPTQGEVQGWHEQEILTRQLDASHYVLPLNPYSPPEIDIIYSEDGKTLIYYPWPATDTLFVIPTHVTTLADNCFKGCAALKHIVGHDGIISIGKNAFAGTSISEFNFSPFITELPDGVFSGTQVTEFTVPQRFTRLGNNAFSGSALRQITIPGSIATVGNSCFANCSQLMAVTIEEGVQSLGDSCFAGNTFMLKKVEIPASVTYIGEQAFYINAWQTYGNLQRIDVDPNNRSYTSVDGVLYDKAMTRLMQCPGRFVGELIIPEGVTATADYSISHCSDITRVVVPSTMQRLGEFFLNNSPRVTELEMHAVVPPAHTGRLVVSNYSYPDLTLYVPAESLDAYKEAYWGDYLEIYPIGGGEIAYQPYDIVLTYDVARYGTPMGILFQDTNGGWFHVSNHISGAATYKEIAEHVTGIAFDGVEYDLSECLAEQSGNNGDTMYALYIPHEVQPHTITVHTDGTIEEIPSIANLAHKVRLPESIKRIKSDNYLYNSTHEVILPESLEELGDNCFNQYPSYEVNIPRNVSIIGEQCFASYAIGSINVDPANQHFASVDGVLYSKDMTELLTYPLNKPDRVIKVPEGVERLEAYAFDAQPNIFGYDHYIDVLTLPSTLRYIGDYCFRQRSIGTLICNADQVPELGIDALYFTFTMARGNSMVRETRPYVGKVYVPDHMVQSYLNDAQWSEIFDIEPQSEMPEYLGATIVRIDSKEVVPVGFYRLDGSRSDGLHKGINIVRMSDGSVKTIMMQ